MPINKTDCRIDFRQPNEMGGVGKVKNDYVVFNHPEASFAAHLRIFDDLNTMSPLALTVDALIVA